MKVLTIVCDLEKGGTQRTAQVFSEAYHQLGHDSRLLAVYKLGSRYAALKDTVTVWPGSSEGNLQAIKEWGPDLIHIHTHGMKEADVRSLLGGIRNASARVVETNVFSAPSLWADLIDVSFQLSCWAQWLFRLRGGEKWRNMVVPNPVDCRKFNPKDKSETEKFRGYHGIPANAFVLGRIGQPAEFSWSPMLVRLFNELAGKYAELYLMLVGPSRLVENMIAESPYADRVVVIPELIGDDNLSVAYSSLDLMVHAAEGGESFGLVNAEAVLCGTPVVTLCTPWAGNSQCEVVGNMKGGYVVHSFGGMKKAVEHFMQHRQTPGFLAGGREYIIKKYDHLQVARTALDYAFNLPARVPDSRELAKRIPEILEDSFDRPAFLTKVLISLNRNAARKWTIYSSSYRPLHHLPQLDKLKSRWSRLTGG